MIKNARAEKSEQWEFVSRASLWFTGERRQNNGIFCQQMLISSSSFICFHTIMIVDAIMSSLVVGSTVRSIERRARRMPPQKAFAAQNCIRQHTFVRHNAYCVNIVLHRARPRHDGMQRGSISCFGLHVAHAEMLNVRRQSPGYSASPKKFGDVYWIMWSSNFS